MTKNDTFYKILFAIEIALLPLVMAVDILLPSWTIGLFVAGILVANIWLQLFKNKNKLSHMVINSISSIAVISVLVIFFTLKGYFETYLCVLAVTFVVLSSILKAYLYNKSIPETISAVDFCYALFEIFFLIGLAIISINTLVANIGLFAVLLTSAVLTLYKVYYTFRYTDLISKIKNLFTRK